MFCKVAENMQFQEVEYIRKSQGISINKYDDIEGIFEGTIVKYLNRDRQDDIIHDAAFEEDVYNFNNGKKS